MFFFAYHIFDTFACSESVYPQAGARRLLFKCNRCLMQGKGRERPGLGQWQGPSAVQRTMEKNLVLHTTGLDSQDADHCGRGYDCGGSFEARLHNQLRL